MNRVLLFLATNFAVVLVLSVVLHLLGVDQQGQNLLPIIVVTSIFGMGGAFVSLWLSKSMSLRATGARLIEQPASSAERWLVETVRRHATKAGIGMPDVAVFDSPTPNAFATGADRNHALVAVSTGLLQNMGESEVEAVLGHEISHVANGDMVTLTLIQGVVNTFVMVFARLVAAAIDRGGRGGDYRGGGIGYFAAYMVAQAVLGFLASLIVMWFSRRREFRADAGGATLAGRAAMIAALERLQRLEQPSDLPPAMAAFGITGELTGMLGALLASHPPLAVRIAALRAGTGE
ncbi:MAG: protease HtpX [Gammaproteobacteria bacterium]|nr:protease HtpX [Gammaproteobacteria bacterium]MBI5617364.1 protease HtpX [Gammaproteobacteria bacterium]